MQSKDTELKDTVTSEVTRQEPYEQPTLTEHKPLHELTGSGIMKFGN